MPIPLPTPGITSSASDSTHYTALLTQLYEEQLRQTPDIAYLAEHARPRAVAGHVAAFHWYRRFLPLSGAVLDWGCNHAPDSCLIRAWAGDRYTQYACDFNDPERFSVFHSFAACQFSPLRHLYQLPYSDWQFEAVIGSGVLEHTAMDYESLKELHRVLKPGGTLVITYLPNRWSVEEWIRRVIHKRNYHRRVYGLTEIQRLLTHTGFEVIEARNQAGLQGNGLSVAALRLLQIPRFSSVLCLAVRKVMAM